MVRNKITFAIGFIIMITNGLYSQTSLNTGGGEATGSGGESSFSIGQTFVETLADTSGVVSQGVQQPYEWLTLEIGDSTIAQHFELQLFPNPTSGRINLLYNGDLPKGLVAYFYDSNGKLLLSSAITQNQSDFDISPWPVGVYYLRIHTGDKKIITYKIIKN